MNKTELLDYYSTHYLSRQEILFKLPFNISAEEFWKELLERRRAKAIVLPLCTAQLKPYWYVMTDKMVKASEVLCEEAMKNTEFDPYRMEMTSAMTWEMLFTSYVEGAEFDINEALDYLSCDRQPSNVREQLLWNNRQAMGAMVSNLYCAVDKNFVFHLAYLLTQDMDGTVEGYRDHEPMPLTDESKIVPRSYDIPDRMNELFAFLEHPNAHPLIKAAVAQAFVITTRPFLEGYERLARLLSMLILYRSGYDFFKDISISRKIARESYRYYKNVQELLKPENNADMTCFVEYYIDLLARALVEAKEEDEKKKSESTQAAITQERQMAVVPLSASSPAMAEIGVTPELSVPTQASIENIMAGAAMVDVQNFSGELGKDVENETPAMDEKDSEFWAGIKKLCGSPASSSKRIGETVKHLVERGVTQFTVQQWAEFANIDHAAASEDCSRLRKKGLIKNLSVQGKAVYCFCLSNEKTKSKKDEIVGAEIMRKINELEKSTNNQEQRMARVLQQLINTECYTFTRSKWEELSGTSKSMCGRDIQILIGLGLVYRTGAGHVYKYRTKRCV